MQVFSDIYFFMSLEKDKAVKFSLNHLIEA